MENITRYNAIQEICWQSSNSAREARLTEHEYVERYKNSTNEELEKILLTYNQEVKIV